MPSNCPVHLPSQLNTDNALPGTSGLTVALMMLRDPKGVADQFPHQLTDALSYLSLMPVAGLVNSAYCLPTSISDG
jgi:hypothetical protein